MSITCTVKALDPGSIHEQYDRTFWFHSYAVCFLLIASHFFDILWCSMPDVLYVRCKAPDLSRPRRKQITNSSSYCEFV
jgi:hypothetical protein